MKPLPQRNSPDRRDGLAALNASGAAGLRSQSDRRANPPCQLDLHFIRLNEVLKICGKSRSSVYESIQKGEFPPPVKLCGRSSAWVRSEVIQWAQDCIRASRSLGVDNSAQRPQGISENRLTSTSITKDQRTGVARRDDRESSADGSSIENSHNHP